MSTVMSLKPSLGLTMFTPMSIAKIAAPTTNCERAEEPGTPSARAANEPLPSESPTEPIAKTTERAINAK